MKQLTISKKNEEKKQTKKALLKSIQTGLSEVELIKKGELKSIPLKDLLNEL